MLKLTQAIDTQKLTDSHSYLTCIASSDTAPFSSI